MATKSSGPDLPTLEKQASPSIFTEALWRKYELELTGFVVGLIIVFLSGFGIKFGFTGSGVILMVIGIIVTALGLLGIVFKWVEEN